MRHCAGLSSGVGVLSPFRYCPDYIINMCGYDFRKEQGPGADSEEKREPVSDIDTVEVDSLKALDSNGRLEKRP